MHATHPDDGRATKALVLVNVAIYLVTEYLLPPAQRSQIMEVFGLSAGGLARGWLWQLVTHQFLHGNMMHILLNMLALWFAGGEVERVIGRRLFLILYFTGGIVGGLAQVLILSDTRLLIGASGSVFAVLIALTTLFPEMPITALIFFVLPLRMRAKYLGIGIVATSLLMWLLRIEPGIGHLAHLGGALTGFLFAKGIAASERRSFRRPAFSVVPPPRAGGRTVEEIIGKILRDGIETLTHEEREILEIARRDRSRRGR
jgi:membrane associated rhomboid family serine protease